MHPCLHSKPGRQARASCPRSSSPSSRGSAVVELLIILPILLLIIFAMLYIGELILYKGRMNFGGEYAMDAPGDQSEQPARRGIISDQFYTNPVGELTVIEQAPEFADFPESGELREMFDLMSEIIYSTVATGRYVFSGGQLQFVVQTRQSRRLSRDGQYVERYGLRNDNIPELATDLVQDWQLRNRVDMTYSYNPDYIRVGQYPLEAIDFSSAFQSTIRTEEQREVTNPPAGMKHQIDAVTGSNNMRSAGRLPHYPDFSGDQPFWFDAVTVPLIPLTPNAGRRPNRPGTGDRPIRQRNPRGSP